MKLNTDLTHTINLLFSSGNEQTKDKVAKELLPILGDLSLSDDVFAAMCSLYKGKFPSHFEKLYTKKIDIDRLSCVKLNIMLQNGELSTDQLSRLSEQKFIKKLSLAALLTAAKTTAKNDQRASFRFVRTAGSKINDTTSLYAALNILKTIGSKKDRYAKLTKIKIALAGNCTLRTLADYLKAGMLCHNIDADVWEAPFDQWAGQMLDNNSDLYRYAPSFLVLHLSSLGLTISGIKDQFESIDILEKCIDAVTGRASIKVVLILPGPMEEECYGSSKYYVWRSHFTAELKKRLGAKVVFVDPIFSITDIGSDRWFASRFWYHAKLPCHPNAMISVGHHVAITLARCISSSVKVVVCDLDNTLWGGIVGDEGYQNLKLDAHSLGGPYIRLQAFFKTLIEKGILLVAVSKNNEEDVREVFSKREEMLLKEEDFTMIVANWTSKSENIAKVAESLNLGLEHFCFIDDSPFEREEVRTSLPDVIVPELPKDPEDFVPFLAKSDLFYIPTHTEEDKNRLHYYRDEIERSKAMGESGDLDSFLRNMNIKVRHSEINGENIDRVVQLVNKTNQFNLTTRRHDQARIRQHMDDNNVFSHCYKVSDRLGDSGIVGVLIAIPGEEADVYSIDSWLLSCRVMGRTVERGMFEHVLLWMKDRNVRRLVGEYMPTKKNRSAASLYEELGFNRIKSQTDNLYRYAYDLTVPYRGNKYITLCG